MPVSFFVNVLVTVLEEKTVPKIVCSKDGSAQIVGKQYLLSAMSNGEI
jgi:hypothetical protein